MGSKDRRERERVETREKILDAARELFVRDGVDAVTMRAIADRIEYTPTAIYHHFKDKTHLVYECCAQHLGLLAAEMSRIARTQDPVERLRQLGRAYAEFGLKHPNHYRFMFMTPLPPLDPEEFALHSGDPEKDAYAAVVEAVQAAIDAGRLRPEYADPHLTAQMLWATTHGIVSLYLTKGDQKKMPWRDVHELVRVTGDTLIRGLLVEGDPALEPAEAAGGHAAN